MKKNWSDQLLHLVPKKAIILESKLPLRISLQHWLLGTNNTS